MDFQESEPRIVTTEIHIRWLSYLQAASSEWGDKNEKDKIQRLSFWYRDFYFGIKYISYVIGYIGYIFT